MKEMRPQWIIKSLFSPKITKMCYFFNLAFSHFFLSFFPIRMYSDSILWKGDMSKPVKEIIYFSLLIVKVAGVIQHML